MTTERDLDIAEMDTDLELDELFDEFDRYYYGGRHDRRTTRDNLAQEDGEDNAVEGPEVLY